jgi:hypothetical protein
MVRSHGVRRLGWFGGVALAAVVVLAVAIPASAHRGNHPGGGANCGKNGQKCYQTSEPSYVDLEVPGEVVPLVGSGEEAFGTVFEGLPDGIGVVPGSSKNRDRYVDLYVTHEQSHVPFGGFADHQDSSVTKVRVSLKSMQVTDMDVALSPSLGFIRFCSAFMAGPEHGFPNYTFLVNEESNDPLPIPAGAPYGPDPSLASGPYRQAGYAAYLNTATGRVGVLGSQGRMNHENTVIVPGGWHKKIVGLSGDDTFTFPSTPERPNLSQFYMSTTRDWRHFKGDESTLWAFRVTGTGGAPIDPTDPYNGANDYLDMTTGDDWTGEFIRVPEDVARGTSATELPQDALEDWSNANNVFQFVRVEDIAYDPDNPRVVYFADTGNSRLVDPGTGRLYRAASGGASTAGRVFKMVLNRHNPKIVDSFSILVDAADIGMRNPDNVGMSRKSLMVQEDTSDAKIWRYSLSSGTWTHVATANQPTAETSGIVDVSKWFGSGWWALDVQSHTNQEEFGEFIWNGPGGPAVGSTYVSRRENGQLLLMKIPGS